MNKTKIPIDIQNKVQNIISDFNKKNISKNNGIILLCNFQRRLLISQQAGGR